MFSSKNRQYWTWVIVSSALGIFIVLQKVISKENEVLIYRNSSPVIEMSLNEAPQPALEKSYINPNSVMKMDATSLNNNPASIKIYLKTLIQKINKQEAFINNIIIETEKNKAAFSIALSKQKEIDRYAKVIESIQSIRNKNGFNSFSETQKAYLQHNIQYTKEDDLSVINYTNGVRRYYLTLLNRSI